MGSCSTCKNLSYRSLIGKPVGMSPTVDIPCLRCRRLNENDEYVKDNAKCCSGGFNPYLSGTPSALQTKGE